MRIKLLSIIALILTAVSAWAEEFVVDGINYQTNSDDETTVSVVYKTPKYEGDIVIPASVTYDGKTYGVTSIGGYAFYECSSLTSINIPDGVTSIGWDAFYGCSSLTRVDYGGTIADWLKINFSSADCYPLRYAHHLYIDGKEVTEVVIPDGVTSIGDHAFEGCSSLTSITIPNSVTSIGWAAFSGCSSLTSITIPDGVTSIGGHTFYECSSLTSITIPDGVTSIGWAAFEGCGGLTSITIPSSVTSIGNDAFRLCYFLEGNFVNNSSLDEKSNNYWDAHIFDREVDGIFIDDNEVVRARSNIKNAVVPDGVTSIGDYAFEGCSSLTSITIPNSVTSIGEWAFSGCSKLIYKEYGNALYLGSAENPYMCLVKAKNESITSCSINSNVKVFCEYAFRNCSGLTRVDYGGTIADWLKINFSNYLSYPLYYAHHLYIDGKEVTEVVIPEGVTSIGEWAFRNCSGLTSITIPSSVTSIGWAAFDGCSGLTSITIPENSKLTSIENYAFQNCSSLTGSITIPDGVTSIGDCAFSGCSNLTSITIPNSVTSIGGCAFRGCSSLTSITIPDGVKSIGYEAFDDCRGLTSITIPSSVTSIEWDAFYGCSNLKQVATDNTNVSMIESALGTDRTYIVPCTLYDQYVAAGLTTTKQHDLAKTEAVAATCTETGLTEGSHCEACHATVVAQETTEAIGHLFIDYIYNNDATTAADGTETAHCDHNCGTTDTRTAEGTKLSIPTGVGQVSGNGQKVVKTIEDGRVVIIRDGVKYDVSGRKL